ncbi:hypothetical protein C0995_009365 [Termitomyces sp. Mi166|nr:hypothetical protein C0995_009365 [Termitomyces sp. Mi166\
MPKRKGHVLSHLSNFGSTAKHTLKTVVKILSPQKKRRVRSNKENEYPASENSLKTNISLDSDAFMDTSIPSSKNDQTGSFSNFFCDPQPPATVLDATYIEYSLPPPQRRSPWVEDVPEEDSDSISLHHNDNSILVSFDQTLPCDLAEIDKTDSITSTELGDGLVQSAPLKEIREGKLCEAPNILQASLALKDLMDTL